MPLLVTLWFARRPPAGLVEDTSRAAATTNLQAQIDQQWSPVCAETCHHRPTETLTLLGVPGIKQTWVKYVIVFDSNHYLCSIDLSWCGRRAEGGVCTF